MVFTDSNKILNGVVCAIIIAIILQLADSYYYYINEDDKYITSSDDFIKYLNEGRYSESAICKQWQSIEDCDRVFLRDLMCHEIINYKDKRPGFKKMYRSACKQIVVGSLLSALLLSSSFTKSVKQNSLGYFISNVI